MSKIYINKDSSSKAERLYYSKAKVKRKRGLEIDPALERCVQIFNFSFKKTKRISDHALLSLPSRSGQAPCF